MIQSTYTYFFSHTLYIIYLTATPIWLRYIRLQWKTVFSTKHQQQKQHAIHNNHKTQLYTHYKKQNKHKKE